MDISTSAVSPGLPHTNNPNILKRFEWNFYHPSVADSFKPKLLTRCFATNFSLTNNWNASKRVVKSSLDLVPEWRQNVPVSPSNLGQYLLRIRYHGRKENTVIPPLFDQQISAKTAE